MSSGTTNIRRLPIRLRARWKDHFSACAEGGMIWITPTLADDCMTVCCQQPCRSLPRPIF